MTLTNVPQAGVVELDDIEWRLLQLLRQNTGKIVTHLDIANNLWPVKSRINPWQVMPAIYMTIASLRRKIEVDSARPQYLANIRGVGYVLYDKPPSRNDGIDYAERALVAEAKRREVRTVPPPLNAPRGRPQLGPAHRDYAP